MWLLLLLLMFDHTLLYILLCLFLCCPQMHNLPFNIFLVYFFLTIFPLPAFLSLRVTLVVFSFPLPTLPSWLMPSLPCPLLFTTASFATPSQPLILCFTFGFFPVCCFVFVHFSNFKPFLLWTTFFPVTCLCLWLPMLYLSSAHGGLPPTPAAGVPCPSPARHGYRGQAHQAAGQLLRSGDPKDGCLSLWGGH